MRAHEGERVATRTSAPTIPLQRVWPLLAALPLAVLLVLVRGRPSTDSDAGIFLSVAARLLDGDRLYADVWDNKDPLFYYTLAGALASGDWRLPFLLDVLWLALAGLGAAVLLRTLGATALTSAVGLAAYPLLLSGAYYYAGYSMLPALALAPIGSSLWLRGHFLLCGALIGVAGLYKANLTLVVASAPIALAFVRLPPGAALRQAGRAMAGCAAVLTTAIAVLAARGELRAYGAVLRDNVSYAGDVLAATGRPTGIYGHLWSVAGETDFTPLIVALGTVGLAFAAWTLLGRGSTSTPVRAMSALYVAGAVATMTTLATTAVWDHHLQMLAYPGFLLLALATSALEERVGERRLRLAAVLASTVVVTAAFGGFSRPPGIANGSGWTTSGHSATAEALERARTTLPRPVEGGRYAVLGTNREQGHAEFLTGSWELACPRFHQYPFSPRLDDVSECIRRRRPDLVLVVSGLTAPATPRTAWERFGTDAARLLAGSYTRVRLRELPNVEVWRLR